MQSTARLRYEALTPAHAAAVLAYYDANRAHLAAWEPARDPAFYTLAEQRAALERDAAAAARGECARFGVYELAGGSELAGLFNLWNIRRGAIHAAIIGYSVASACEGRGYATEAAGALVRYAFEELGLHRVETSYQPANERSGRVLRRLGFVVEGYARDYLLLDGAWRDGILVAKLNAAWRPPAEQRQNERGERSSKRSTPG